MNAKKSLRPVLVALSVMLIGLFMLCAHNQTIETPGEDLAGGDDEFRQELLDMLDLASEDGDVQEFAAGDASIDQPEEGTVVESSEGAESAELSGDDQAELLKLLAGVEEEADAGETPEAKKQPELASNDAPQAELSAKKNNNDYALDNLRSEVERLQMILEKRSQQVDSLRRIIDNRNARLAELQQRKGGAVRPSQPTPLMAQAAIPAAPPAIKAPSNVAELYNLGRSQFESFNYSGCIETMKKVLQMTQQSSLSDNAQYWIGESYYGLKQYQKAVLEFQKVFSFNATDKYDDAQLMIGLCYVRMGQKDLAHSTFSEFLETYEGSEYIHIAQRYYENI